MTRRHIDERHDWWTEKQAREQLHRRMDEADERQDMASAGLYLLACVLLIFAAAVISYFGGSR